MLMTRSTLLFTGALALVAAACNTSSKIGANDQGGAGPSATSTAAGSSQGGAGGASTASTGSGAGPIQGAHVEVMVYTPTSSKFSDATLVGVLANTDPLPEITIPSPSACTLAQSAFGPPRKENLVLSGASAVVTALGKTFAAELASDGRSLLALLPRLPTGTQITVAFDASSSLLPGQTLDLTANDNSITAPLLEKSNDLDYQEGTDLTLDFGGDLLPFHLSAYARPLNLALPPVGTPMLESCTNAAGSSTITIPAADMAGLVSDLHSVQKIDPTAFLHLEIGWTDVFAKDQPLGGNFVSRWSALGIRIAVALHP
jgi:hypothetical protein